jgi:hypothetical protein
MDTKCEHKICTWSYDIAQCDICHKIFKRDFEYEDLIKNQLYIESRKRRKVKKIITIGVEAINEDSFNWYKRYIMDFQDKTSKGNLEVNIKEIKIK